MRTFIRRLRARLYGEVIQSDVEAGQKPLPASGLRVSLPASSTKNPLTVSICQSIIRCFVGRGFARFPVFPRREDCLSPVYRYPKLVGLLSEVSGRISASSRLGRSADCGNHVACFFRAVKSIVCLLAVFGMVSLRAPAQRALTLPRSLDQLTEEAAVIVRGSVISAKIEPHPQLNNLMTAVITMRVLDSYKGKPPKTLVFRQYLWDLRAQLGTSEYGKGQEVLLLLGPVSEFGLTSPVGLEQGRFRISRDRKGLATAVNGRDNLGLFDSVGKRSRSRGITLSPRTSALVQKNKAGPLPLADLEDAIRTFAGAR